MPQKIFLSYRKEDSASETELIHENLEKAGHISFKDDTTISLGDIWPISIENSLKEADVVIAVIGPQWLTSAFPNSGLRRLDDINDWVRKELQMALNWNKKIIPVFVKNATTPNSNDLPEVLQKVFSHQGIKISNWTHSIGHLLKVIEGNTESQILPKPLIILTSESPRRKELLQSIGWNIGDDYVSVSASINLNNTKTTLSLEDACRVAKDTACRKIQWLREHHITLVNKVGSNWNPSQTIVIGVDTIVFCGNKILDRPLLRAIEFAGETEITEARHRAKEMLIAQRGKRIYVITGLALAIMGDNSTPDTEVVITEANLREYTDEDIDNYIFYSEPFDKAGAFGIQEKGVSLFNNINGCYSNIVGLPLTEFIAFLEKKYSNSFTLPTLNSKIVSKKTVTKNTELEVVCVGDINYDFIYDKLPVDFFSTLKSPGEKIIGKIYRAVGGTAINFAKGAKKAGFSQCYVVGVIGGDPLGGQIARDLYDLGLIPILRQDPAKKTSIVMIIRDDAKKDISLTITDADQSLPDDALRFASTQISDSDVFYCSGYCLTDENRQNSALKMMHIAKEAGRLVILDVVVGMGKKIPIDILKNNLTNKKNRHIVNIVVSEMPDIFDWFSIATEGMDELEAWEQNKHILAANLRERFSVAILRTSHYTHEVVITPYKIFPLQEIDYGKLNAKHKVGYGDLRTAAQIYSFLSPRIVLASQSPQRLELLRQIFAPSKIQVITSNCTEKKILNESPSKRVARLAMEKAYAVFLTQSFHDHIELIIGADTEIYRHQRNGRIQLIGHPTNTDEAYSDLKLLNNSVHYAITGLAIIGKDPKSGKLKRFNTFIETEVTFINATDDQLRAYADSGESIGRAGAYAIQGLGSLLIKSIKGSYSNVVGLPLENLSQILYNEFHKSIWDFNNVSKWSFPDPIKSLEYDEKV